ncbi:MAG: tetratricopeptide repeat protein [Anaerohalosphaeraceae bacterium]
MKSRPTQWLLFGMAILSVSLTAMAREKPDNRGSARGNDRPAAPQKQESPQPQPAPPAEPAKPAEKAAPPQQPSRPIQRSEPQAAVSRDTLIRPAAPAAKPVRPSEIRTMPQPLSPSSLTRPSERTVRTSARESLTASASKPPEKPNAPAVRPTAPKSIVLRPMGAENRTPADNEGQTDAGSTSSARFQSRLNTQRRVIVADSASGRNRLDSQNSPKETNPSVEKSEIRRPQNLRSTTSLQFAERSADKPESVPLRQTETARTASDRSGRRVIVSKIERPAPRDPRDGGTKPQPPSERPLAQSERPGSQSIIRADELREPSRNHPDREARASVHNSRPSHKDRYDSKITITPEKKIVVVGDITPHRPRPYIPRRLHPDLVIVRSSPHWHNHGSYFSLTFSFNSCARLACVPYHSCWGLTYYYPRYHRRYVFVSIGGWWPCEYRYIRYYWYGCHPYYWYGPTVITPAPVIEQNTYNTYNYYGTADTDSSQKTSTAWKYPFGDTNYDVSGYIEKISAPDAPQFQTAADLCFDRAVNLFLAGKYADAAAQFREAVRISPDDIILPFTYSQALFADGDYAHAAAVLRSAVAAIPDDQLTIYYPRGLYDKEEVLLAQIEALEKAAQAEPFAADFHLLLGYQYIGIEQYDKAADHLKEAAKDLANQPAAQKLLDLLAQLQQPDDEQPL